MAVNNIADGISQILASRGLKLFENVSYIVDGSCELSNSLIEFALRDEYSNLEIMRIGSISDLKMIPLGGAASHQLRKLQASESGLRCARKVQLLLFMLSDEINGIVVNNQIATIDAPVQAEMPIIGQGVAPKSNITPQSR